MNDQIFQILLVLIAIIAQFASTVVPKVKQKKILFISGAIAMILAVVWVGRTIKTTRQSIQADILNNTEFRVINVYPRRLSYFSFENNLTKPWDIHPNDEDQVTQMTIAQNIFAFSGQRSLAIDVDLGTGNDAITVRSRINEKDAKAILAYIFVPESPESSNNKLFSSWTLSSWTTDTNFLNIGKTAFDSPQMYSKAVTIRPGEWTPIFASAGVGFNNRSNPQEEYIIWNGGIYDAYFNIWSEKPYLGTVYIDDVQVFGD